MPKTRLMLWAVLAISTLFLISINLKFLIATADNHAGMAAWVQAVGTIAALAVALWVSNWQQNRIVEQAKKDRFGRMQTLTFRLLPIVEDIAAGVERVKSALGPHDYGRALLIPSPAYKGTIRPATDPSDAIKIMTIGVAWRDNIYDQFDALPPEWAQKIADLLYETYLYDRTVRLHLTHAAKHGVHTILDIHSVLVDPSLARVQELLAVLEPQLQLMRVA